jgi:hypothetical protein
MIVYLAFLASIGGTALIVEYVTGNDALGYCLGVFAFVVLTLDAVQAVVKRESAIRLARQRTAIAEREQVLNTGTWQHPDHPAMQTKIRYQRESGTYFLSGWVSDFWTVTGETERVDTEGLATLVRDLETEEGLVPADDEGTRAVKARLGLPWADDDEPVQNLGVQGGAWLNDELGIHPRPSDG